LMAKSPDNQWEHQMCFSFFCGWLKHAKISHPTVIQRRDGQSSELVSPVLMGYHLAHFMTFIQQIVTTTQPGATSILLAFRCRQWPWVLVSAAGVVTGPPPIKWSMELLHRQMNPKNRNKRIISI
jgi:hypothetical protein